MKTLTLTRVIVGLIIAFFAGSGMGLPLLAQEEPDATAFRRELVDATNSVIEVIEVVTIGEIRPGEMLAATLYKQEDKGNKIFAESMNVPDCSAASPGLPGPNEFCKSIPEAGQIRLLFLFRTRPAAKDTFSVSFATIATSLAKATTPSGEEITNVNQKTTGGSVVQVQPESPKGKARLIVTPRERVFQKHSRSTNNCVDASEFVFTATGAEEMAVKENHIEIELDLPDDSATVQRRVAALLNWLESQKANPAGIAEVKIERRDQSGDPVVYPLKAFSYRVQCREQLLVDQGITILLLAKEDFPTSAFDIQVKFNNAPPMELARTLKASHQGFGSVTTPAANKVGTDKTLGLRSFDSNLDLGLAFTSSVSDVKKGTETVRERQNAGAVDLRFQPWFNLNLSPPARVQHLLTPIFFDAKVASGKITEKSLSLNRILIGTEYAIRYIRSTKADEADKHVFSFRYVNASDRDFKRIEGKFNFETLLLFAKLNKPLSEEFILEGGKILPDNGFKVIPTKKFGYQIQPVVGVDLGGIFRRKRETFDFEEESKFVRRLYFGGDIKLNLTRHLNLTISDTFYLRGETPRDLARNYFLSELETPLGSIGQNTAQSIFFSFERGDQPPFATPGVNSFKIGYRFVSNFGRNGTPK